MLGDPNGGRVSVRRAAVTAEIVQVAWQLADRDGLNGFSLRDVAKAVGMQPPSLYSYVASKHDLFDLMFRQGLDELLGVITAEPVTDDPRANVLVGHRLFLTWCTSQPAKYTLVFLRTVPGFAPSELSMAKAFELYDLMCGHLATLGVTDPVHIDLWTALTNGLAAQQIANEPDSDRWTRLLDDALTMFLAHVAPGRRSRR